MKAESKLPVRFLELQERLDYARLEVSRLEEEYQREQKHLLEKHVGKSRAEDARIGCKECETCPLGKCVYDRGDLDCLFCGYPEFIRPPVPGRLMISNLSDGTLVTSNDVLSVRSGFIHVNGKKTGARC